MLTLTDVTEQKRIEDQLRALATTDTLTGALTRRHFFDLAELEWTRSTRHRHPLCVALIDVDHFKTVNDRFGHGMGDEALRLVAETVRGKLRRHDLLGRYGGDELALLFPETPLEGARQVSDRIRRAVAEIQLSPGQPAGAADDQRRPGRAADRRRAGRAPASAPTPRSTRPKTPAATASSVSRRRSPRAQI